MIYIFSIFDSGAQYFREPFTGTNKGVVIREFGDAANRKDTFLSQHPGDYSLFLLGTFDELTAQFHLETAPVRIGTAIEFVTSEGRMTFSPPNSLEVKNV